MTNHPGRKPAPRLPDTLREALAGARLRSGLTQAEAARLISAGTRTWTHWEAGDREMPLNAVELWLIAAVAHGYLPVTDPLVCDWVRPAILAMLRASPDQRPRARREVVAAATLA